MAKYKGPKPNRKLYTLAEKVEVQKPEVVLSDECQVLSTRMHRYCRLNTCQNPMHETNLKQKKARGIVEGWLV